MSEPAANQDAEHLRLLSIFHYVCAGLAALFACFPLIHLAFGLVLLLAPELFGPAKDPPPPFLGWFFVILAGLIMVLGWTFAGLMAWAGRNLARRRRYTFCLVMAALACMFMPFGTVLGVFTIMVLVRPSVKALFDPPRPA
jgi:hypothetical protein